MAQQQRKRMDLRAMAMRQLMSQQNPVAMTNTAGAANMASSLMKALMMKKMMAEEEAEKTGYSDAIAAAAQAGQPWVTPDNIAAVGDRPAVAAGQPAPGTGGPSAVLASLMGSDSKRAQQMGAQAYMKQAMTPKAATFKTLTPEEATAAGYREGTTVKVNNLTGEPTVVQAPAKATAKWSRLSKKALEEGGWPQGMIVEQNGDTGQTQVKYTPAKDPQPLKVERLMEKLGISEESDEGKRILNAELTGQTISISTDSEGGTQVLIGKGAGSDSGLQKGTVKALEGKLLNAREGLGRLSAIESSFQDRFLTYESKVKNWGAGFLEKAGVDLDDATKKELAEYTTFRTDTFNNLNRYIKEITGAQMSEAEAKRITAEMPNLNMSPTEFKAALASTVKRLKRAAARYHYALNNGFKDPVKSGISLDMMPQIIDQRGQAIMAELTGGGMDEAQAQQEALSRVAKEFGLRY